MKLFRALAIIVLIPIFVLWFFLIVFAMIVNLAVNGKWENPVSYFKRWVED